MFNQKKGGEKSHETVPLTDHNPLVGALCRRSDPWTGRQQHHLSFIAEFSSTIHHIAGQSNVVVDTLYRPAGGSSPSPPPLQPEAAFITTHCGLRTEAEGQTEVKVRYGSLVSPLAANPERTAAVVAESPPLRRWIRLHWRRHRAPAQTDNECFLRPLSGCLPLGWQKHPLKQTCHQVYSRPSTSRNLGF